jgi:hypothetical protein|tara:strand:+ start:1118 stop:1900 length:783 start_codon:yes stop_codon:yes gene_type:complete
MDPDVTLEAEDSFSDDVSVSSVSDVHTDSDLGSPRLTGVRGVLRKGDKLRERVEDFCNDIHDAYTFDLNPEFRLKVVKKFDGLSVGARFDCRSGDCVLKAKRAPSATPGGALKFWRLFKKIEVKPEDRQVEAFSNHLTWGVLTIQGIGGWKQGKRWNLRYKLTSTLWENTPGMLQLRSAEYGNERARCAARWDLDVKPPKAEGGFGDGMTADDLYDFDIGSYHVAVPRLELKINLSHLEAARQRAAREAENTGDAESQKK